MQRRIAGVLGAYDELIENNRRRVRLLEEAARLLYREWFVRLRFPGHERVRVVDGVPEGWRILPLVERALMVMGQSPPSSTYNETGAGLPFHQGVTDFGSRFPASRIYCERLDRVAEAGDILFSVRAPVGRINVARERMVIGRGLAALRARDGRQAMLYYQLKARFHSEDMIGTGSIYAAVKKDDLAGVELLSPPPTQCARFCEFVGGVDRQIAVLESLSEAARRARDLLLPRLMAGEIEV